MATLELGPERMAEYEAVRAEREVVGVTPDTDGMIAAAHEFLSAARRVYPRGCTVTTRAAALATGVGMDRAGAMVGLLKRRGLWPYLDPIVIKNNVRKNVRNRA